VFSDRICIATHGRTNVVLSPEDLVSCDRSDLGCSGGWLGNSWSYIENTGVETEACFPYTAGSGIAPACQTVCVDGTYITKYKTIPGSSNHCVGDVNCIKNEIAAHGPVDTGFDVYQDFFNYYSGIYKHVAGSYAGGHAVKIVGYGVENGLNYWIAANSWGTGWGEQGFFRIAEGNCNFDNDVWWGLYPESAAEAIV